MARDVGVGRTLAEGRSKPGVGMGYPVHIHWQQ